VPHSPQWKLAEMLGCGGFGEVWLARHTFLEQACAFKFCLDAAARDRLLRHEGEVVKRVMAESRGASATEHGIVPLVDAYLEGETPWLAYQYVDGGDLTGLARQLRELPPPERGAQAVALLQALAGVVGRFHRLAQPIIHRDLKPANVLLARHEGRWLVRVTDFGISHIAAEGSISRATVSTPNLSLGETFRGAHTPLYASPQQKRGQKADVRDDVHALGVIGYQLLLGDLGAERPAGKWRKRVADCGLPEATLELLESCWDDDPEERPGDGLALVAGLQSSLSSVAVPTSQQSGSSDSWQDVDQDYDSYLAQVVQGDGTRHWLQERLGRVGRWQRGVGQGNARAMVLLGDCYEEGIGVPQDYALAMKWYRLAADAGNPAAMENLGMLHDDGRGVSQDHAEAMKWYRKAADVGHPSAMNNIGDLYQDGSGVRQDHAEAMKWYRKAADARSPFAMYNVGRMYQNAWGVGQNYAEAMKWYRKAADAGNTHAMNAIGLLYRKGLGVSQDYTEAMKWYRKAADAGNAHAMHIIGRLYENGLGVSKNQQLAREWYKRAADAGYQKGKDNLERLEKSTTRGEPMAA
jgi:TPR repeat protein